MTVTRSTVSIAIAILSLVVMLGCQSAVTEPTPMARVPDPTIHPCVKIATSYYWVATPGMPDGSLLKQKLEEINGRFLDAQGRVVPDNNTRGFANNLYYSTAGAEEALLGYSAAYDPDSWLRPHSQQTASQRWATRWVGSGCSNK